MVLCGQTVDTNAAWLSGRCSRSASNDFVQLVPDETAEIVEALRQAVRRRILCW